MALVFFLCVANYLYASILIRLGQDRGEDKTATGYYAACAFSYLVTQSA